MADTLDQLHADVGLDLLRADVGPPALVVYDSAVPKVPATSYVLVYTHIERPSDHAANSADGMSDTVTVRWYCHCVGPNAASARAVAMRVRAALLDVRPSIAGRSCGLIRQESTVPPTRDESTGVLVIDTVQVYRLTTTG